MNWHCKVAVSQYNVSFHICSDALHLSRWPLFIHPTAISPHHAPQTHASIAVATAHAACLLAAASLRLSLGGRDALAATQPDNQARELCQKWVSYRGRRAGRTEGGTADLFVSALWCYATSCTHTHAPILWQTHTDCLSSFSLRSHTHTHTLVLKLSIAMLNQHKLQIKSLSTDYKMTQQISASRPSAIEHWCNITLTNKMIQD